MREEELANLRQKLSDSYFNVVSTAESSIYLDFCIYISNLSKREDFFELSPKIIYELLNELELLYNKVKKTEVLEDNNDSIDKCLLYTAELLKYSLYNR